MIDENEKGRIDAKRMPDGYVVLDPEGDHVYSAKEWDYCNDHINDCLDQGYNLAGKYVIRGFILLPLIKQRRR